MNIKDMELVYYNNDTNYITFAQFFSHLYWYDLFAKYAKAKTGEITGLSIDDFEKMANDKMFLQNMKKSIDSIHINIPVEELDKVAYKIEMLFKPPSKKLTIIKKKN